MCKQNWNKKSQNVQTAFSSAVETDRNIFKMCKQKRIKSVSVLVGKIKMYLKWLLATVYTRV